MSQAESQVKQWLRHRTVVQDILERIPDDKADFRPWNGAMSVSELVLHIAVSAKWFTDAVQSGQFTRPDRIARDTMEETRATFTELTEQTNAQLLALTDEQINGIVNAEAMLGFSAPGKVWLTSMREHEVHHKGQLFVYAHLAGVQELPFFINKNIG